MTRYSAFSRALGCIALLAGVFPPPASPQDATATGISREFNPAISVNALFLYRSGLNGAIAPEEHTEDADAHEHAVAADGLAVQEAELQLTSFVDPYVKANLVFAMHGTDGFEMEEGFAQALFMPRGVGLRAGKIYFEFGKHNAYHTHQYPFVERPHAWDALLGEHGLNGVAVEASWLTPLPWYAEIVPYAFPLVEAVYGDHEIPANTWGGGAKLRQLWDVSGRGTLDLGLSYAGGKAAPEEAAGDIAGAEAGERHLLGADVTYKWTGSGAHPRTLEVQAEWLRSAERRLDGAAEDADGLYVHALTRFSRRLAAGARFDLYSPPVDKATDEHGHEGHARGSEGEEDVLTYTASLAFIPSEFQAVRMDLVLRDLGGETETGVRVQYNVTIGSHPAHRY